MPVIARFKAPVSATEPFRSMPADPPALEASELRRVYVCPDHPETIATRARELPDRPERSRGRAASRLTSEFGSGARCIPRSRPTHAGEKCAACGGMTLEPRVVSFRPAGQVLAVPRSAVIDGGAKKVVFIESMPGMFDGVEVVLGPRCGEFYPVVRGLEAGQNGCGGRGLSARRRDAIEPEPGLRLFRSGTRRAPFAASPAR